MLDKRFAEIGKADIDALVTASTPEDRTIEYKSQLPAATGDAKKEFVGDVAAFANASGGYLIFGVEEAKDDGTSTAKAAPGVCEANTDEIILRFENLLRDGVEPRINGIQIKSIAGFETGPVYVIHIPKSWNGPHLVKANTRFYSRNSAGKFALDVTQIRAAFLGSQELSERIQKFRDNRVGRILAGETPVPLSERTVAVLHLVPISLWAAREQIDISQFINQRHTMPAFPGQQRPNLDGWLGFPHSSGLHGKTTAYAQLFRHGAIEYVDQIFSKMAGETLGAIPSETVEIAIVRRIQDYMRLYSQMDVRGDVAVFLSMLGVRDFYFANGGADDKSHRAH